MKVQQAVAKAELLGQPFTAQQKLNRALSEFEKYLGKDAYKIEDRWIKETTQDWESFKTLWKAELHQWDTIMSATKQANAVALGATTWMASKRELPGDRFMVLHFS